MLSALTHKYFSKAEKEAQIRTGMQEWNDRVEEEMTCEEVENAVFGLGDKNKKISSERVTETMQDFSLEPILWLILMRDWFNEIDKRIRDDIML